jgi:nitrate/TMAO reductase-like tetraheme cytochrome c subunit
MKKTAKLFTLACSAVLLTATVIHARLADQQQPAPQADQPKPAVTQGETKPETLQVLKGMDRGKILQTMRDISAGLGVECNYCHIRPFEQDTPSKSIARLMLRDYSMGMKHKDGSAVSCKDCHKGQPTFLRNSPFEGAVGKKTAGLQVLKSDDKLMDVMTAFTKALGVDCAYCHVKDDFDAETPRKQIARFMMTEFSRGLVKQDGSAVSCNDCHQGHARPLAVLSFPRPNRPQPAPAEKKDEKKLND